jgi:hypothetical protein
MHLLVCNLITLARAFTSFKSGAQGYLIRTRQVAYYRRNLATNILHGPRFLRVDNSSSKYPLIKRIQIRSSL